MVLSLCGFILLCGFFVLAFSVSCWVVAVRCGHRGLCGVVAGLACFAPLRRPMSILECLCAVFTYWRTKAALEAVSGLLRRFSSVPRIQKGF